jgi:tRNA (Thr-GGU) A37 N-methylase
MQARKQTLLIKLDELLKKLLRIFFSEDLQDEYLQLTDGTPVIKIKKMMKTKIYSHLWRQLPMIFDRSTLY